MSDYHFILDFETLGPNIFKAPIINCSYYVFDWTRFTSDNPYTFKELIVDIKFNKLNVKNQVKDGCAFTNADVQWWEDQGEYARKQLTPLANDISVEQFYNNVKSYIGKTKISRWWSRSNCFDPILLQRIAEQVSTNEDLNKMLPFWNLRDVRTFIDTRFDFKLKYNGFCPIEDEELWKKYFIKHNSVHDVAADVLRMQRIERLINL